jgi:hypothetical protein
MIFLHSCFPCWNNSAGEIIGETMNINDLILDKAPEEQYSIRGKTIIVRRDDLAYKPPLPPNAKMSALFELIKHASAKGYDKAVMFAKKQQGTSYAVGFPVICELFGIAPIITYPSTSFTKLPKWTREIEQEVGFTILRPNMVTINVNQSKRIAEKLGAYFVPFGFDDALSVETHAKKFSLPDYQIGTLVLATMTGMILAGTLKQIDNRKYNVKKVIAVSGGRPVESVYRSMSKYIVDLYETQRLDNLEIFNPYKRDFPAIAYMEEYFPNDCPLPLHPDYEAKAWLWMLQNINTLEEPIYFINAGR